MIPVMNIGIIGSGKMGAGLGRLWAKSGHHVLFSYSRRFARLESLVEDIGSRAQAGTAEQAVRHGDVILLAVTWDNIGDALVAAGPLDGKTLLTCVNPIGPLGIAVGLPTSAAEEIAKLAPGANVIETFNTIFASLLTSRSQRFDNDTATVFYCGADHDSKATTAVLVRDAGFHGIDAGPLRNARYLESLAMLMMELGYSQRLGAAISLRLMNPAGSITLPKAA
jgi:predicted dinucleotide-binding enzyme